MLEYLQTLFAPYADGSDETPLCEIRCLPSKRREYASAALAADRCNGTLPGGCRYFGLTHLHKAADYARAMRDTCDVYVGVLPRARARVGGGGRDGDVTRAAWLWADIDAPGAEATDLGAFLRAGRTRLPAPQMCVLSGSGGAHLYWRLSVPVPLETPDARQRFVVVLRRLVTAINLSCASSGDPPGIRADPCARNPSRILRVPGTGNHKYEPPAPVRGILCAPSDIRTFTEWESSLPCEPHRSARRRQEMTRLSIRGARFGGRDPGPIPAGLRAWAGKGYPEGQRHIRLTAAAAWLRRDTDLPEPLAHDLFLTKARASPGGAPAHRHRAGRDLAMGLRKGATCFFLPSIGRLAEGPPDGYVHARLYRPVKRSLRYVISYPYP